jgi:DNA mismatch repair protein MutS2
MMGGIGRGEDMEADGRSGRGIEWNDVRALLAAEASTPMGRDRAGAVTPLTEATAVEVALDETAQARAALGVAGTPPWNAVPDARPVLDRCRTPGAVLDGPELLPLISLLETGPRLRAYGRAVRPVAPILADLAERLPPLDALCETLRRCLADDGSVVDGASPALARLRARIRDLQRRIVRDLEALLQTPEAERIFSDRYVTRRNGRYVVPVRAEARGRLRGIVHDRSQSGQTLFVEPERLVEANNDLVEVQRQEEQETARILADLSEKVRAALPELDQLVSAMAELDWIVARARLADRMKATRPTIDPAGFELRGCRHPLLLAQAWRDPERGVVPVDLELRRDRPLVVITGPNAGGKTIALKTAGLLSLMAQVGCHLPAEDGGRLPVIRRWHAVIGDEQSVADNLSTFSGFVRQMRDVLDHVDGDSLVLLDELGAGTDPDEGAALAQAILEELADRGALVLATTHLEPLKGFASTDPRARNASVEFDRERLTPTFRLVYDHPGQSYALAIAARLGLSGRLIGRAQSHRSEHTTRLSELIARLDSRARDEAERALVLERREVEAAARLAEATAELERARERARDLVTRAKQEAAQLLGDIRRAVAHEWDRLKHATSTRRSLEASGGRLRELAAAVALPAEVEATPDAQPVPGDQVEATHLGIRGRVREVTDGTATVESGTITIRVPVQGLRRVARGTPAPTKPRLPERHDVPPELHLLGRTTDEARHLVEKYLDDAFLAGLPTVRLVHGKGTGALRKAVHDILTGHPLVDSFRPGAPGEGGAGATVATLRVG